MHTAVVQVLMAQLVSNSTARRRTIVAAWPGCLSRLHAYPSPGSRHTCDSGIHRSSKVWGVVMATAEGTPGTTRRRRCIQTLQVEVETLQNKAGGLRHSVRLVQTGIRRTSPGAGGLHAAQCMARFSAAMVLPAVTQAVHQPPWAVRGQGTRQGVWTAPLHISPNTSILMFLAYLPLYKPSLCRRSEETMFW